MIEVIDTKDTVLAVLVYPDGAVRIKTNQNRAWVAETLRTLTDSLTDRNDEMVALAPDSDSDARKAHP